jgi:hypothetical protein
MFFPGARCELSKAAAPALSRDLPKSSHPLFLLC